MPWGSTKLVLGFVFSHGSGALKSFRLSLPQTLVMYSPGKGSGKFQESASGNMEAGMAGQATGSCQGQQGTGSGSNTLDPWGDYLQRQQFVQQTLNQVGGPRIPSTPTNGSRGGSSSPNPHQGGFWNQGLVTQPGVGFQQLPGVGLQQMPPGLGNSMDNIVAARGIFQQMNPRELQVVFQEINQRLNFQRQGGFVPERLGQARSEPDLPTFVRPEGHDTLPPVGRESRRDEERDVFSRSEKWLSSPPQSNHESWRTREDEILGMNQYLQELVSWANQGSVEFGREIAQCARWTTQIAYNTLTKSQQSRAVRLFSLLKAAFNGHGRISLLIQGFSEGLDIVAVAMQGDFFGNSMSYMGNGYELLRQLVKEFSLRSRSEAVSLRASLMSKVFQANAAYGAPVADTIRQIEVAVARYLRLVSTLIDEDVNGLGVGDSDQLTLLIRSLAEPAKSYVLHHSQGESYGAYRRSALKYEHQQRLFLELQGNKKMFSLQPEGISELNVSNPEVSEGTPNVDGNIAGLKGDGKGSNVSSAKTRCSRCGQRDHDGSKCTTDLSKKRCFKCHEFGHISTNCRGDAKNLKGSGKPSDGRKSDGKGSSSSSKGGKSKSKGGKKGKMFAVFDDETQSWWYTEVDDHQSVEVSEETEDVMVISCVLGSHGDSWLHETGEDFDLKEENEPNTHVTDTHVMSHVMILNDEIGSHGNQETAELSSSVETSEGFANLRGECGGNLPLGELFGAPASCCGSEGTKVLEVGGSLNPLLNSIGKDNIPSDYWLIDSGASCCVINKQSLENFCHSELVGTGNAAFTAANGTPVLFCGRCEIVVKVRALDSTGKVKPGVFKIPVMVGETPYNILSTYVLGKRGWKTVLTDSVSVVHERSNVQMTEVMIWCDTPWVRVKPHHGGELILSHVDAGDNSVSGHVSAVKRGNRDELEVHRAKGHVPFHPDCEHCIKAKGVHQHRRKTDKGLATEVAADFMFLSCVGERISIEESVSPNLDDRSSLKILVVREAYSSTIGAVVMSANLERDRTHLVRWLDECGLSSTEGSVSVTLVTDSEQSVSTFVARSSGKYHFLVRKAGPQVHEQNGGVENAVRSLKQSFKTLQSDFETMRASVDFRPEVIQLILNYCCFSHNIHGLAFGSERSPREIAVSRRLPVGEFAMFGSKVLAEIPKSVEQLNPNLTRFVSACYLHPQFSSCGSLVLARIRVKDELVPKIFVAKSLKLVFPIELGFESGMFVVLKLKGEEGPKALDFDRSLPSDVSRVLPSNQGVSLKCPPSGPPKEFIDRYGISPDCKACQSIDEIGTRKGFSHSKSCCRRYEDWLRIQVQGQEVGEPVVRDSLGEALEEYAPTTPEKEEEVLFRDGDPEADLPPPPPKRIKTRHCPACETGMDVPGIRHTKECVKRNRSLLGEPAISGVPDDEVPKIDQNDDQKPSESEGMPVGHDVAHIPDMEVDGPEYMDTEVAMTSRNMKRESDVPLENLEEEIRRETETDRQRVSHVLSSMVSAAFGVSDYVPLSDMLVDSVQFAAESDFAVMTFGSQKIKIWKPSSAVDDSDMSELPGDQTHDGMIKEVGNLRDMEAGDLMTLEGVEKLKRENPGVNFRTIGCRWVATRRTVDTVRSRIVVKDVAEKNMPSARSLGISSPTPSTDAMFLLLAVAGCRNYAIGSADIAHAFMATPLRVRDVIIKLPLSVSSMRGEGMYIWLRKALNGLRKSSQDWVYFLSSIVKKVGTGLTSCSLEPCLFTGVLPSGPCGMFGVKMKFCHLCLFLPSERSERTSQAQKKKED